MSLSSQVLPIRLGDFARNPRYIETIAGQGYRFIPIQEGASRLAVRPRNGRKIDSLAVLPFANGSVDPDMEFLTERITERVIDTISRISGIGVLAYSAVQRYREKDLDPRRVGQNLLVRAVAAGEMIRRNDELLLHVELIDVGSGSQLWGAQFKEPYSDVLAHTEKLADEICHQLRLVLAPNMRTRGREPPFWRTHT